MSDALVLGVVFGAVIGLAHACGVYAARAKEATEGAVAKQAMAGWRAAYFALWTFVLWLVLGSYVLYLWIASLVVYALYFLLKGRAPMQTR